MHGRDVVEGPLLGVGGEDVGEARVHAHADERQLATIFPELLALLLIRTEHQPWNRVRVLSVGDGEARRHVDVVHASLKGGVKHCRDEAWIHGVQDKVGLGARDELL